MGVFLQIVQLLLALSLLVFIHELGHFLAARAFGMRVEKFFVGFPPKIVGKKFGETEWAIGAIPLGGFVKISGMVDESMDKEFMRKEPQPWEFRSKPAWQRLIVMLGGIIMNVIGGIIIYTGILAYYGERDIPASEVQNYGIVASDLGRELGFETGDIILNINGQEYERYSQLFDPDFLLGSEPYYTVLRDGQTQRVYIEKSFYKELSRRAKEEGIFSPRMPVVVDSITADSPARAAGLQKGDSLYSIDGQQFAYFHEMRQILQEKPNGEITLGYVRQGEADSLQTAVNDGKIGFYPRPLRSVDKEYSLGEAVGPGVNKAFTVVVANVKGLGKIFSGEIAARDGLTSPIGMVAFFDKSWDWQQFWGFAGLLSMVLAFMNLLPIPALDGGHVVFLLGEMVSGRKPSEKVLERAQMVGMIMLLGLMVFAFSNDILKIFGI